jgi:cytochrome c oxidase subunit 2
MKRRALLASALFGFFFLNVSKAQERVIKITAKKFEFTPAEVVLKKGEPVTLELTTEDVTMGFYAKDFNVDVEIVPGRATQVRLTPAREGTFDFICDVFCGDGHEDMGGKIRVTG